MKDFVETENLIYKIIKYQTDETDGYIPSEFKFNAEKVYNSLINLKSWQCFA